MRAKSWHVNFQEVNERDKVIEEHKFEMHGVWKEDVEKAVVNNIVRLGIVGWKQKWNIDCAWDTDSLCLTAGQRNGKAFVTESLFGVEA